MYKAFALLLAFQMLTWSASAQQDDIPDPQCDGGTQQMVACLHGFTMRWDKRLNAAYQEALKDAASPAQRDQLRAAQRLWVQYRDANCDYYGLGEGSISRLNAASCLHDMTRSRAQELERGPEN